ncbi:hypothetical protein GQ457_05G026840 [Hibiscus cannabinus]
MRQEGVVEGALPVNHYESSRYKKKKKFFKKNQNSTVESSANNIKSGVKKRSYPPCQHCNRKGHPPYKCWSIPHAKCTKCNQMGHETVIYRSKNQHQSEEAKIVDREEEDQLLCRSKKRSKWIVAREEELSKIEKNKIWILVDRPQGRKVFGVKWVFRTKLSADGSIKKRKARLLVKGYAQMFVVDYSDTFTPEENYLEQLQGFAKKGKEDKVFLLKKALYGLKQAPRAWYNRIDDHLLNFGFKKSLSESTLYVKHNGTDILIVSLYVDDLLEHFKLLFTLGSGVFSWCSKKQETMVQSTAEAEFVVATTTTNQALWLRKILNDLNLEQKEST